ncbi:hypothetical protein JL720_12364 [Aureococcus anophagefferens]|nr:hypothetical protein JL720_12364 [Aureococcus anophagefferens]
MSELKSERTGSVAPMASTSAASLLTSSMSSQGPSPGKMASPSAASLLSGSCASPKKTSRRPKSRRRPRASRGCPANIEPMLEPQPGADAPDRYESRGSWSYTWWLPDDLPEGEAVPLGTQGPPQTAGRDPASLDFAVLSPQKPKGREFADDDVAGGIVKLVDAYVASHRVDASRVYLTGVSAGGVGCWGLGAHATYRARWAAIAPICGGLRSRGMRHGARALAATPVWCFHGANDDVLPVSMSDTTVDACARAARSAPLRYSRLEHAAHRDYGWPCAGVHDRTGHAAWVHADYPPDRPAGDVPLYAWLLDQSRSQDAAEADEPEPWIVGASKPVHPITGLGPSPGNQAKLRRMSRSLYVRGERRLGSGRYEDAADLFRDVHLVHAWASFEAAEQRHDAARGLCERALALDPASAYVRHAWGVLERDVFHDDAKALALFEDASAAKSALLDVAAAETRYGRRCGRTCWSSSARARARGGAAERAAVELSEAHEDDLGDARRARAFLRSFLDGGPRNGTKARDPRGASQRRCAAKALARLERDAFGNLDQAARWYARALREDSASGKPDCGVAIAAAECAVERGHHALARELLGRAAKAHPKRASPWIALAKLDVARGDRDAAERCFGVALKAEPTHGAASLALGKCRHEVWRDAEGAKDAYKGGLATLHRDRETSRAYAQWAPALWHAWAQVELAQDAHGRAATLLNRGLKEIGLAKRKRRRLPSHGKDEAFLRHSLGSLELRRKRPKEALDAFRSGYARLEPTTRPTRRDRAAPPGPSPLAKKAAERLAGSFKRTFWRRDAAAPLKTAPECFDLATRADPSHAEAWTDWAAYELKRGDPEAAAALLDAAAAAPIVAPSVDLAKARSDRALRDDDGDGDAPDAARQGAAPRAARGGAPGPRPGRRALRRRRRRKPRAEPGPRGARRRAPEAVRRAPPGKRGAARAGAAQLLAHWSDLELKNGGDPQAKRLATLALRADGACAEAHVALGNVLDRRGDAAAEACFEDAVALDPALGPAHAALAALRRNKGDFGGCRAALARGLDDAPNYAHLWHAAAELEAILGNLDGLAKLHERARDAFPSGLLL